MEVMKTMTEEYFGETLREECYIKYDKEHDARNLTKKEAVFLTWLSRYTMYLDMSLFFQVGDLQRHTKLVLSGKPAGRYEFPDPDELEKEIEELQKVIEEFEDELKRGELPEEYREILREYYGRLQLLMGTRGKTKASFVPLLGEYIHNHGVGSKVILYVNNIEECAKNPHDTMLLMGQVLLHEYFHSFYYHVGVAVRDRIRCIEEPMAEYGSLVVLDSVKSSRFPKAKEAGEALTYAYEFVKAKQKCTGTTAAYGFGAFIFDSHKEDYSCLIPRYANLSRLLDDEEIKVKEYKYLVYPVYPLGLEETAYKRLREILFSREHRPSTKVVKPVSSPEDIKIGKLARREFTARIPFFSSDLLVKLQDRDYCTKEFGLNLPVLSKKLIKTCGKYRYYVDPVDGYYICSEWYERSKERLEVWLLNH